MLSYVDITPLMCENREGTKEIILREQFVVSYEHQFS